MHRTGLFVAAVLALASGGVHAAPPALSRVEGRTPVIVELFTSEGCSDCPAADTLLDKLVGTQPVPGAEIIALGEHVDYWDRLGWKDRFSSAAVTSRQQVYQKRFATESIYTPQMVVDGRAEFVGSDAGAARKAIEKTLTAAHGRIGISVVSATVQLTISDLPPVPRGDRADIVLVIIESGLSTEVKRGENHGKVLKHAPVVRYLSTVGHIADGASGGTVEVGDIAPASDWKSDRLAVVAFVQERHGRTILASASARLK